MSTSAPTGPASAPPGGSTIGRRRLLLGLGAVVGGAAVGGTLLGLDARAGTLTPSGPGAPSTESTESTTATAEPSTTSTTTGPSPFGGPGTTTTLTYTPPTASRPWLGDLTRPVQQTSTTAVVLVHGGGGTGGDRQELSMWRDFYAEHGVLTLDIDYRLVDPAVDHGVYPVPEQNVKAAVQYVRRHAADLGIDRVVVQGHSAGARLGGIVLTTPDDPAFAGPERWPDASDAIDGLVGYYGYYDGGQFEEVAYYGGDGSAPGTADSTARAGYATGPVRLVHGDEDFIVADDRSRAFARALQENGAEVILDLRAGETHAFDGYGTGALTPAGRASALETLSWLTA